MVEGIVEAAPRDGKRLDPSALSTRELELRLRQASLMRPGSALRLRGRAHGDWEAAFTLDPGHPVRNRCDLPTWIAEERPSKRGALVALWRAMDERPELHQIRRIRDC